MKRIRASCGVVSNCAIAGGVDKSRERLPGRLSLRGVCRALWIGVGKLVLCLSISAGLGRISEGRETLDREEGKKR